MPKTRNPHFTGPLRARRPATSPRPRRGPARPHDEQPTLPFAAQALVPPAGLLPRHGTRLGAWFRAHAVSLALVAALLALVAVVLGTGIERYPALSDDEGTYVAQAWAVVAEGSLAHYTYWYDHPPLGWLQLAAAGWLLDPILSGPAVVEGRRLMLLPALVSCGMLYMLARRLGLARGFAAAAVLLFALSPLSVSFLRMVYLDNIALPWILAAFVLAASPRARLWA